MPSKSFHKRLLVHRRLTLIISRTVSPKPCKRSFETHNDITNPAFILFCAPDTAPKHVLFKRKEREDNGEVKGLRVMGSAWRMGCRWVSRFTQVLEEGVRGKSSLMTYQIRDGLFIFSSRTALVFLPLPASCVLSVLRLWLPIQISFISWLSPLSGSSVFLSSAPPNYIHISTLRDHLLHILGSNLPAFWSSLAILNALISNSLSN